MHKSKYALIIVDNTSTNTDKVFTYIIPEEIINYVEVGKRVLVPFGKGNRLLEGLVIDIVDDIDFIPNKLKSIKKVIDDTPIIPKKLIELGLWMRDKYLAQYIEVFKTIIPTGVSNKVIKHIKITEKCKHIYRESLDEKQKKIIEYLFELKECELSKLKTDLHIKNINLHIKVLEEKGLVEVYDKISTGIGKKYEKFVKRVFDKDKIIEIIDSLSKNAIKQIEVIKILKDIEYIKLKELMIMANCSYSTIKSLYSKGLIEILDINVDRSPIKEYIPPYKKVSLTEHQKLCLDTIINDISKGNINKFLIHGVTGSGKTEVYLQLIEKMLNQDKDSIVLVPEISLTPQTVERFVGRFGDKVAILHSRLSIGERYDEWRKIKEGKVKIVVGARSAVFAPFSNLGLIIIDEEHENSYKSSMNPKYSAIEVAEKRCDLENAALILGSATPSIETYYRTKNGDFKLLEMPTRVNKIKMPSIEIVDMKEELEKGNKSIFSESLFLAIKDNLCNKKQTILFLNRRGFSTFISCRKCGYVVKCSECDISMTYHLDNNVLKCHYCGLSVKPPTTCPECGSRYIKYFGIGTQKVEEYIKKIFPSAKVARMDVDNTTKKGSHERILNDVKNGEVDILIGTQMISKGLDFPNVTLVGIIAADISLNLPDFRASERTFQLVTQVSGRAGRGDVEGRVILQTYQPQHYSILASKEHDYKKFYDMEIKIRKEFKYPPYTNIINIVLVSKEEIKLKELSKEFYVCLINVLKQNFSEIRDDLILGPNPAPIYKIRNNYRYQIMIKCRQEEIKIIKKILKDLVVTKKNDREYKNIKISIDINPISVI
ncbi:primosome assembly protein PriA [Caloranaerobacter sp. TR13]|uniref:primosomal protein N' n=1 Tax=Caloranaerobacter sp. TR13 TaxID=1302151 RepID=UPI0006D47A5B|nr:primosomal protein N' [Caloranaerobacter sp. TR13]KPU28276.1 primosome assembly protein PriA [Caloranaerobacter sp. TR13]